LNCQQAKQNWALAVVEKSGREEAMFNRYLISGVMAMWVTLAPSQARLGETLEQCQARYGAPLAKITARKCLASDADVYLFGISDQGRQLTLRIEFYRGLAWFLGYSSSAVREHQPILELNKGASDWGPPLVQAKRSYWRDTTGKDRCATAYKNSNMSFVEIATVECVSHLAAQRLEERRLVLEGKAIPEPATTPAAPSP
jgi:hypothetical protein